MPPPIRMVLLVARDRGLAVLEHFAHRPNGVRVAGVFTHRRLPKAEDPARSERPEFRRFAALAGRIGVPLNTVDTRAAAASMAGLENVGPFDVLLAVSWRFTVPAFVLHLPRVAAINLHRGKLPDYASAEPVRRAIEAGDRHVTLTAHRMTERIDDGQVLVERLQAVGDRASETTAQTVERIKCEMLSLYPLVADAAIASVMGDTIVSQPNGEWAQTRMHVQPIGR